ncbi:MAG: hypothetical protein CVU66_00690 [Deltaproteobacteria bacterium HGW-Deltaproteobacteria-23]|nr:MAG: hypothetical protein CVU66_00690 [Deltaproteobacteria bacterium HGW-Deltaproteobacteria-23]
MAAEKDKIVKYLENQLKMMKERLRTFETPIDENTLKDIRKVEELILKKQIWLLEDQLEVIKMM